MASLTAQQISIVKSTAPVIQEHRVAITSVFYKNLLSAHPELKNYFSVRNQQTGAQQLALANALFAYATNIDNLGELAHMLSELRKSMLRSLSNPSSTPLSGSSLSKRLSKSSEAP